MFVLSHISHLLQNIIKIIKDSNNDTYYKLGIADGLAQALDAVSITYVHHSHSLTSTTDTYEDNDASTANANSLGESQSTSGGCFTKAVAHYSHSAYGVRTADKGSGGYSGQLVKCPICGQYVACTGEAGHEYENENEYYYTGTCYGYVTYTYSASCGYTNGEVLSAIINLNK